MMFSQVVVWIDHNEAHIIQFERDAAIELTMRSKHQSGHTLESRAPNGSGHAPDQDDYHLSIEKALTEANEILIVGPSHERTDLKKHIHLHDKALLARIIGVEHADNPTTGALLQLARRFFPIVTPRPLVGLAPAATSDVQPEAL